MHNEFTVVEGDFANAGKASSEIKKTLKQLNIDNQKIKKIVVAVYEAEVNAIAHAYGGTIYVDLDEEKICVLIKDKGPGIPDIARAMEKGFSTASAKVREMGFGAGMGLPNIKNNVDELDIQTEVGVGTEIKMIVNFNS
ncbi:MAG: anti-sigma regulatory factor [Bacteroidales bacterium]|uniref:Serine/threonine-protein kinase RsbT n=1 Tax=bioreactor metagenome TaxID=1076179 RepID=A0A644VTU2_9ZZZZ|nr:anti-sigma regulatory factor [Bacteroidales bacterium]MEA4967264.1 anti-sigma regulatory factor [Bacteroidaceae bacterium]NCC17441.1 anti-sigma regulatory factor [Bacteroidia bacterium]MDD2576100.1 anti-sigma regulatory factor [Bacteroidales bacterium]MDD4739241.1 anti-sigma regulatory factor [Bacteroidales bacterium]